MGGAGRGASAFWRSRVVGGGGGFGQTLRTILAVLLILVIALPLLAIVALVGIVLLVLGAAFVACSTLAVRVGEGFRSIRRGVTGRAPSDAEGRVGVRVVRRPR